MYLRKNYEYLAHSYQILLTRCVTETASVTADCGRTLAYS